MTLILSLAVALMAYDKVDATIACNRSAIDAEQLAALTKIEDRLRILLKQKRDITVRRTQIARRRVEIATMSSAKRALKGATDRNFNERDLEKLDAALQQENDAIGDEARLLSADTLMARRKREQAFAACGYEAKNA